MFAQKLRCAAAYTSNGCEITMNIFENCYQRSGIALYVSALFHLLLEQWEGVLMHHVVKTVVLRLCVFDLYSNTTPV
jgi:hypothetical protein